MHVKDLALLEGTQDICSQQAATRICKHDHGVSREDGHIKLPNYAQELDTCNTVMTNWITESMCKIGTN
jgi:hypothetical protein